MFEKKKIRRVRLILLNSVHRLPATMREPSAFILRAKDTMTSSVPLRIVYPISVN